MAVIKVNLENFSQEVLKSDKPVLLDMYADWCGPCMMMAPEIEAYSEETDKVKVCKLDVDEATDLALTYGVMSIPTVLLIENGKEVKRFVGAKEKHQIAEFVGE
ncbi:MAG: thioredoxin [Clostridia bacterium]|nr:thioredoxin [Clostridia bacterium]